MDFQSLDGLALADLVRTRQIKPLELVDAAIDEIERLNPMLNAVVSKQYERARNIASGPLPEGPFQGVPFLIKDLGSFDTGVPCTLGSRFFKDFKPTFQSEIVRRYYKAGLIPLGRTNTPEFGIAATTESDFLGPARNPWNTKHTTGGSSGGSAAAVSSGMVALAHAGDGGGSIRIPASCCGVFGLKPSEGHSPTGPVGGRQWNGLVVEHVITRSVRDSAAALDILTAPERGAPLRGPTPEQSYLKQLDVPVGKLKIGIVEQPYFEARLHSDCRDAVLDAAKLCESLGHHVEETQFNIQSDAIAQAFIVLLAAETNAAIRSLSQLIGRPPKKNELELFTYVCSLGGQAFTASDYANAIAVFDEARRAVAATFAQFDVILTPTLALPPPRIGDLAQTRMETAQLKLLRQLNFGPLLKAAFREIPKKAFRFTPYTFLFNITGQPAMSVPLHWNAEGLPIGSHFVGEFGSDGLLLRLAKQLDEVRSFAARRPAMAL